MFSSSSITLEDIKKDFESAIYYTMVGGFLEFRFHKEGDYITEDLPCFPENYHFHPQNLRIISEGKNILSLSDLSKDILTKLVTRLRNSISRSGDHILLDSLIIYSVDQDDLDFFKDIFHCHVILLEWLDKPENMVEFMKNIVSTSRNNHSIVKYLLRDHINHLYDVDAKYITNNLIRYTYMVGHPKMLKWVVKIRPDINLSIVYLNSYLYAPIVKILLYNNRMDSVIEQIPVFLQSDNLECLKLILDVVVVDLNLYDSTWLTDLVRFDSSNIFEYLLENAYDDFLDRPDKDTLFMIACTTKYQKFKKRTTAKYIVDKYVNTGWWIPNNKLWIDILLKSCEGFHDCWIMKTCRQYADIPVETLIFLLGKTIHIHRQYREECTCIKEITNHLESLPYDCHFKHTILANWISENIKSCSSDEDSDYILKFDIDGRLSYSEYELIEMAKQTIIYAYLTYMVHPIHILQCLEISIPSFDDIKSYFVEDEYYIYKIIHEFRHTLFDDVTSWEEMMLCKYPPQKKVSS